jgi:transposase
MKKTREDKQEEVIRLLKRQQIRDVKDLESYKLSICHPHSAGIDLGSRELYLALEPRIAAEMGLPIVHVFSTFTSGLSDCCELLSACGIQTVAMESTSVYWTTIYRMLQDSGIEVCLVNPKKFRMVPGRKTDILDCQWLQTLHLYGLLRGSFHPQEEIAQLRSYMAIIGAILAGERNPERLAALRDRRCKKTQAEVAESLKGYYKADQLALLQLNYDAFDFFNQQLEKIDTLITDLIKTFPLKKESIETHELPKKKRGGKNGIRTKDSLEAILFRITGTDLCAITGLGSNTILQIISEVGTDMSKFPSANHFASYLGFVPHAKITGGQIISSRTDRINSYAAQAFKKVVPSLSQGDSALGAFYRRLAPRIGKAKAITAVCRKLAVIFYNTLLNGTPYIEHGKEIYLQQQKEREIRWLNKLAKKYQCRILPVAA